jgi:hypothetical protein
MIDVTQLKECIIIPVLTKLDLYSEAAVNLLLGTAAMESDMGTYLKQKGGGPALGIYQMESSTHLDIWQNYLQYREELLKRTKKYLIMDLGEDNLTGNLFYATAMARIHYYRSPMKLPAPHDIEGIAKMWRLVYNTNKGAFSYNEATEKFIRKYNKYVMPYVDK